MCSTVKDSFYNLIFVLTKEQLCDCIPGVARGGGRWRKTFKVLSIKILSLDRKFRPVSMFDLIGIF